MKKINIKSIISLVFGILSIVLPFVGLIFGIMGVVISYRSINEINNSNEKGIGLAISGMVVSIIGIVYRLLAIIGIILFQGITKFGFLS